MTFQTLDSRLMFSFTYALTDGHLVLNGTNSADTLYVYGAQFYHTPPSSPGAQPFLVADSAPLKSVQINGLGGADVINLYALEAQTPIVVRGQGGNDNITLSLTNGSVDGGADNDTLTGGSTIVGGSGNDVLNGEFVDGPGSGSSEKLDGSDGNDTIYGNGGRDTIFGGKGNDYIYTQDDGSDFTGADFCVIDAGEGHDRLELGASGNVTLGTGDDRLYFDTKRPIYGEVKGDAGRDWIQVRDTVTVQPGKQFKLYGGADNDTIVGSKANDKLFGEGGADLIYGNLGNDTIDGGTGNDTLDGDAGNDQLFGGDGDDSLIGDKGKDSLYGALGIDRLIANDGEADTLSGGVGTDSYLKDVIDTIID